jgi:hypothetical protein
MSVRVRILEGEWIAQRTAMFVLDDIAGAIGHVETETNEPRSGYLMLDYARP